MYLGTLRRPRTANEIVIASCREYEADQTVVRGDTAELLAERSAVGPIALTALPGSMFR